MSRKILASLRQLAAEKATERASLKKAMIAPQRPPSPRKRRKPSKYRDEESPQPITPSTCSPSKLVTAQDHHNLMRLTAITTSIKTPSCSSSRLYTTTISTEDTTTTTTTMININTNTNTARSTTITIRDQVSQDEKCTTTEVVPKKRKIKTLKGPKKARDLSHIDMSNPLEDVLGSGLQILFCGINPGRVSAAAGYHYANNGNHFWPLLHESQLTDTRLRPTEQKQLLKHRVGLTNLVQRMTPSSSDLTQAEMAQGKTALVEKLMKTGAKILAFNGKCIFDAIVGKPKLKDFAYGAQPPEISFRIGGPSMANVVCFVMPSTSGRVSKYQKADKLKFFQELRALRDSLSCTQH